MINTFEIFFNDLTTEAKERLLKEFKTTEDQEN